MLGLIVSLTTIFGVASLDGFNKALADGEKAVEDIIDLSKGPNDNIGQPTADTSNNLLKFHFKPKNMSDGSFLENLIGDKIVVETDSASKTVSEWSSESGKRAFRIAVYGYGMYLQCENGVVDVNTIKYVTFKTGFCLYEGTEGKAGDWVFSKTADTKVEGSDFTSDLKLFVNRAANRYEYAANELTVSNLPTQTKYAVGDTFNPAGMTLTAATVTSGTKTIEVTADMCSADLSTAGEQPVTVSYGGKTASTTVTVEAPTKTVSSIAVKEGASVSLKQYSLIVAVSDGAKIVVTYTDESTEEKDITIDMLSGYTNETVGNGTATVTYGGQTCSIAYIVSAYDGTSYITGIDYTTVEGTDGTGYIRIKGLNNVPGSLKALWDADKAKSLVMGKTLGDFVTINGTTLTELVAAGKVARIVMYGREGFGFHIDAPTFMTEVKNGAEVCLLPGFSWVNYTADALGGNSAPANYFPVENAVVTEPMYFCLNGSNVCKVTESITLNGTPKTDYFTNEAVDVSGLTLSVKYKGFGTETIDVTTEMCSYDFTTAGKKSVTVSYGGKTVIFDVTVTVPAATVTGIAVKDGVTLSLKQYSLNVALSSGAKIVVSYSDNTTDEKDLTLDMISGYTNEAVGSGKAVVTYQNKTCELGYTVAAYDGISYLTGIDYSAITSGEGTGFITFKGMKNVAAIEGVSLQSLWDVDKAKSLVIGKTLGDFVTINGTKVSDLVAAGKVARIYMNGENFGFHIDDAAFMAEVKNGAEICLLPGFGWVTYSENAWGPNYTKPEVYVPIEDAVVTEPMYFRIKNSSVCKIFEKMELKGTPKANYFIGDAVDVTGLTLSVTYKGFDAETINVTPAMCTYDFASAGKKTVTVTYDGNTVTFDVIVNAIELTGVEIETKPTKKIYDFALDSELELDGLKLIAKYSDNSTKVIAAENLEFEGFNPRAFGKQTVTVKYAEMSATFEIEVQNVSDDKYLEIDYASAAPSYESTILNSLVISFILNGTDEQVKTLWHADNLPYVGEYVLINGTKVSDLVAEGKVTRLAMYTSQLVIHLDTNKLVPATWVDKRQDPTNPDDNGIHYIEGESEVVETVTFLPGFQWYTMTVSIGEANDLWGNDESYKYAKAIDGAVLKETITLYNEDGRGWTRPLAKNDDGTIKDDALTIQALPLKTVYTVGDKLELKGMRILAKYADGGQEIIVPGASDVSGFNRNKEGTQTLTFTYFGKSVTFEVTVKAVEASSDDGCGGSITSAGIFGLIGVLAVPVVLRKKKDEK